MTQRPKSDEALIAMLRTGHVLKGWAADRLQELIKENAALREEIANFKSLDPEDWPPVIEDAYR